MVLRMKKVLLRQEEPKKTYNPNMSVVESMMSTGDASIFFNRTLTGYYINIGDVIVFEKQCSYVSRFEIEEACREIEKACDSMYKDGKLEEERTTDITLSRVIIDKSISDILDLTNNDSDRFTGIEVVEEYMFRLGFSAREILEGLLDYSRRRVNPVDKVCYLAKLLYYRRLYERFQVAKDLKEHVDELCSRRIERFLKPIKGTKISDYITNIHDDKYIINIPTLGYKSMSWEKGKLTKDMIEKIYNSIDASLSRCMSDFRSEKEFKDIFVNDLVPSAKLIDKSAFAESVEAMIALFDLQGCEVQVSVTKGNEEVVKYTKKK